MPSADNQAVTNVDVREEYDAASEHYERRWRTYTDRSIRETLRRTALAGGEDLLDVGCGTGALLRAVTHSHPKLSAAGIDLSVGMLLTAHRMTPSHRLACGDAQQLPFRSMSFDVAVSSSSLHFWPQPEQALREIGRVLRPGGRLVVTDWCDDFVACRLCDRFLGWRDRAHRRIFSTRDLCQLLERSGFIVANVDRYKISWLWGLMTVEARLATN